MITIENYSTEILKVDLSKLGTDVLASKDYFESLTNEGTNFVQIYGDETGGLMEFTAVFLEELNFAISKISKSNSEPQPKKKKKATLRKPVSKQVKASVPKKTKAAKRQPKRLPPKPEPNINRATKVELVDLELTFIRRYVNMHGKQKTKNQIRLFLNSLQKAIIERRIRKTSKYAKQIVKIQNDLIQLFGQLKNDSRLINLDAKRLEEYAKLIGQQIERESIKLIKSYVNLQGRHVENNRAKNLLIRIKRALTNGKIASSDKYISQIKNIRLQLISFVEKNKSGGFLIIENKELNGLNGIVGCAPSTDLKNTIMRSTDFLKMKFDKLNFQGKWRNFIGNPSPGFTTMIFGMPKTGKSYLMIEYAGYLVRNHGSVLYVAIEEELDDTLQEKLRDTEVKHPDLYVSDYLPEDLSPYDFVFLDSVTKLDLTPQDLAQLEKRYPNTSFTYVFQATKHGAFRGSNKFQHNVDVVIEVPKKGIATQYGRFNQGSEMKIFND